MAISGSAVRDTAQPQKQFAAFSLSNPLAAAMAERNLYYGWVVAGSTFLVMLATAGAMGAPGVIIQPLEKEFGWSTAEISVAMAVPDDTAAWAQTHRDLIAGEVLATSFEFVDALPDGADIGDGVRVSIAKA